MVVYGVLVFSFCGPIFGLLSIYNNPEIHLSRCA